MAETFPSSTGVFSSLAELPAHLPVVLEGQLPLLLPLKVGRKMLYDAGAVFRRSVDDVSHLPVAVQELFASVPKGALPPAEILLTLGWLFFNILFSYLGFSVLLQPRRRPEVSTVDDDASKGSAAATSASDSSRSAPPGKKNQGNYTKNGTAEDPNKSSASDMFTIPPLIDLSETRSRTNNLLFFRRTIFALVLGVVPIYVVYSSVFLQPFLIFLFCSSVAVLYFPPVLTTLIAIAVLSWCHLNVMGSMGRGADANADVAGAASDHTDYSDPSGIFMLFCVRLSQAAWEVYDGKMLARNPTSPLSANPKVDQFRRTRAVVPPERPTVSWILVFSAFCVFFPGILVGPSGGLRDFVDFLDIAGSSDGSAPKMNLSRRPVNKLKILKLVFTALTCAAIYQAANVVLPLNRDILDNYLPTLPVVLRILYLTFSVDGFRYKYYLVWSLSLAASTASGFSTDDNDKNAHNVDIVRVETSTAMADMLVGWNTSVSLWLKCSVFERVMDSRVINRFFPKSKKLLATTITRIFSAVWHGFRSGYYLFFLSTVLVTVSETHPVLRWLEAKAPVLKWLLHAMFFNVVAVPFVVLTWQDSLKAWNLVYYSAHIVMLGFIASQQFSKFSSWKLPPKAGETIKQGEGKKEK